MLTSGERQFLPVHPLIECMTLAQKFHEHIVNSAGQTLQSVQDFPRSLRRRRAVNYASPALFCRSRGILGASVPISELQALTLAGRFAPSCPRAGYKITAATGFLYGGE